MRYIIDKKYHIVSYTHLGLLIKLIGAESRYHLIYINTYMCNTFPIEGAFQKLSQNNHKKVYFHMFSIYF